MPGGRPYSQGGKYSRNKLALELKGFDELITKLDELVDDVRPYVTEALEKHTEGLEEETRDAIKNANLPALGRYSTGDTARSVIDRPTVEWSGTVAEIGVGFDKTVPGAGGFLITGTPRMRPDRALEKLYGSKQYAKKVSNGVRADLEQAIRDKMREANGG